MEAAKLRDRTSLHFTARRISRAARMWHPAAAPRVHTFMQGLIKSTRPRQTIARERGKKDGDFILH